MFLGLPNNRSSSGGAVVGFAVATYADHKDDGKVFNGSVGWETYVCATLVGTVVGMAAGAGAYYAAPAIGKFLASSISVGGSVGGGALATSTISITGTQVLSIFGCAGIIMMMASHSRPNNNVIQNKQFNAAAREAGVNPKNPAIRDILREIHEYIRKNKLNLGWNELVELIRSWFS